MIEFCIGLVIVLLIHLLLIEKIASKQKEERKDVIHSFLAAPIHTVLVVGDSLVFMGVFIYFKDITKEQALNLLIAGLAVVIVGAILYRWLVLWSGKKEF